MMNQFQPQVMNTQQPQMGMPGPFPAPQYQPQMGMPGPFPAPQYQPQMSMPVPPQMGVQPQMSMPVPPQMGVQPQMSMPGQFTQQAPQVPVKDSRLEAAKLFFEKLAKDYVTGKITSIKRNTTTKDGVVKVTFTTTDVTRSNTIKRLIEKKDTVYDSNGVLQMATGLDRKCTILSLNITGSIENVGCWIASRFKNDDSRFTELCSMVGWTTYIDKLSQDETYSISANSSLDSSPKNIKIIDEFEQYFTLIKKRSDILTNTDDRNTEAGRVAIKNLTSQMDFVAYSIARRLIEVTDVLSAAAATVIYSLVRTSYPHATDDNIRDFINSDMTVYEFTRSKIRSTSNGDRSGIDIISDVFSRFNYSDQNNKLFSLQRELYSWLEEKYGDIHVSAEAQISMLEVVSLAQRHGLITDVYATFPPVLRSTRINPVNGHSYTAYPMFEEHDVYGNPIPLITESNVYKLGYVVGISYSTRDLLLEEGEVTKEKGSRTKKVLTPNDAIDKFKQAIIGQMGKPEEDNKVLNNLHIAKGSISRYESLLKRERVFLIGKTFNPETGSGLTVATKTSNHQFIWPQAPPIDVRSYTSDGKFTISDTKLVFSAIARSLAFSSETKEFDKNTLPTLIKSLTNLFFGTSVPVEYQNPVTSTVSLYTGNTVGFSSPFAAVSQNSVFGHHLPPIAPQPQLQYQQPQPQPYIQYQQPQPHSAPSVDDDAI